MIVDVPSADLTNARHGMPAIRIAADGNGSYSVFRGDTLLVSNLDYELVIVCAQEFARLEAAAPNEPEDVLDRSSVTDEGGDIERPRGRGLILAPHIDIVCDMLEREPSMTAKAIERRLRGLGVQFTSVTAVRNLARRYDLRLAA